MATGTDGPHTCRTGRRETVQAVEAKPAALCHARRGILLPKGGPVAFPSGELVIDIDHLASPEEACTWRDTLFADERLRPDLAFISPSNTGVKLFVPYRLSVTATIEWAFDEARRSAWEYLEWRYGLKADTSNAELSRACFLCHDSSAKLRNRGN